VFKILSSQILLKEHSIPVIDPSLFIHRFCNKLEFGEEQKKVENTAIRLIQSMNRSWMTTGRRPNGLCGAAILISAKIHGFKRTPA
jgi:transcription factor IIIB subunit 2